MVSYNSILGKCGALWGEREGVVWSICVAGLFPLCQFPFGQFHFVNSHLVNVDKAGIDKVGIDEVGS